MENRQCARRAAAALLVHPGACAAVLLAWPHPSAPAGTDAFADAVISYVPGTAPAPGYGNPAVALGPPERFTGEGIDPQVVSAFHPAWLPGEIVSIGRGGSLVVRFDEPVTDDPANLFGIDLIVFGNSLLIDSGGLVTGWTSDGGTIEVSPDGQEWHLVSGAAADGPMPTIGYIDSGPYDSAPGAMETAWTRPLDPRLTPAVCLGLTHADVVSLYGGAAGGRGIDLAAFSLDAITHVRIANAPAAPEHIEIDAFVDVSPRQPGDVNLDDQVNIADLLLLLSGWGPFDLGDPPADLDNNLVVNVLDLLILLANWSE